MEGAGRGRRVIGGRQAWIHIRAKSLVASQLLYLMCTLGLLGRLKVESDETTAFQLGEVERGLRAKKDEISQVLKVVLRHIPPDLACMLMCTQQHVAHARSSLY